MIKFDSKLATTILRKTFNIAIILSLLFFTILMVLISIPYFQLETNVAFLRIKQWVFRDYPGTLSNIWILAFFIHVFTSVFALIAGFTQFSRHFLWTKVHRKMGMFYVIVVLCLSAPTGFIMGIWANGGIISVIAFCLLSVLWWYFTYRAFVLAKNHSFEAHAKFMYRSYALALSAITLRLWKYVIVNYIYEMPPMDLYRLVGWLGWVPNLLVAEWLIWKGSHLKLLRKKT
ncbi:MAG: DUF2306 domain-containing protein [Crocinitomicaceae bacterium]